MHWLYNWLFNGCIDFMLTYIHFIHTAVVAQFDRSSYIFSNNVGQGTVAVEITGRSEVDIILQYSIKDNRARGLYDKNTLVMH